jgi:hypothetical protein
VNNKNELSRRSFLQSASTVAGASWLRIGATFVAGIAQVACTARDADASFVVLADDEAADFAAVAARVLPTTDTAGATEAGVIHFFDQAFADAMSTELDLARAGLKSLNDSLPDEKRFADLGSEDQDAALIRIETGEFFGLLRSMTIYGMFAMSSYGGNKDNIGWDLFNFKGHHGGWQYPFGFYDAEVHGGDFDDH